MKDIADLRELFLRSYPNFKSFADQGQKFSEEEDDYKRAAVQFLLDLFDEWIQAHPDDLDPGEFDERLKRLFRTKLPGLDYPQNFLNWRDLDFIWKSLLDTPDATRAFMRRLHPLLASALRGRDAVHAPLASQLEWKAEKICTANISKAPPSVLLRLCQPSPFLFIKPAVFDRFLRRIGEPPLGNGKPLTFSATCMSEKSWEAASQALIWSGNGSLLLPFIRPMPTKTTRWITLRTQANVRWGLRSGAALRDFVQQDDRVALADGLDHPSVHLRGMRVGYAPLGNHEK